MNKKIFISYARKDSETAKELVAELSKEGVEAWYDEFELKPGDAWADQIKTALIQSEAVVVILGEGATAPNVLVEAGMALGDGKPIVPVVLRENTNVGVFSNLEPVHCSEKKGIKKCAEEIVEVINAMKNKA